jgi:hypothetical protein
VSRLSAQGGQPFRFRVDAIDLKANDWFERTRFDATKVRNVSSVESQRSFPRKGKAFFEPNRQAPCFWVDSSWAYAFNQLWIPKTPW